MKKHIISAIAAVSVLPAAAQYNQSISVDGKYVPEVFRLDRINSFPRQVKFSLETNPLSYDGRSVPAAFAPSLLPLPATGWRDTREYSDSRGYLDLGAGSWLNSTLSAGYRFIDDRNTTFGVRLQHNSTSLWKPEVSELMKDTRMYRYDESIGFYGSHDFNGKGRLSGAVDWHIGNFNYYGYNPQWEAFSPENAPEAPTQTLNDISARFSWQSPDRTDEVRWNAGAGVRYFGYRSVYTPGTGAFTGAADDNRIRFLRASGGRETDINLNGGVAFPTSSRSTIGIDMNADILLYPESFYVGGYHPRQPDKYGMVTLTPYYSFSRDRLLVRIGADLDLAFNAGEDGDRYSFLHIAPDIRLDYLAGPVSFYLHALGGSRLNTLAANYERDYYQNPIPGGSRPVYSPLDGSLGVTFGPFSGFSAGADFAFRISRGEYLGGWYQQSLNYLNQVAPGLPESVMENGTESPIRYSYSDSHTCNLSGFSLGLRMAYDLGRIIKLEAKGNYQPQNGTKGYFNGYDRPRWTAAFSAETNPWSTLKLKLSYDYRGVRNIYTVGNYQGGLISNADILVSKRLPDITYLNFGASYGITSNFTVWVQADNLLNRHDELLPGLPQQGVRLAAGFGVTF
ncbi:MAG: hypothetical protein K2O56_10020 [Muribaculaceae bacterium]|nr:hypothetical protein [Muribaculaceae bacterium]